MPYQRINWKNGEAGGTPLNESNLNKMDSQIAQNVADIDELKNKPGGAMLVLTNASPLPACDSKPILGIDAKGKSEQIGNYFEQGGIGHTTNANYSANKVSSNTRIRSAELMPTVSGQTYNFTCNSAYKVIVQSFNESGLLVDTSGSNAWNNPLTVTASASMGIAVCKADNSNITPSDATSANILVNGSPIFAPTPTSPIPIIDASGEVSAHTINLCNVDDIVLGKSWNDTANASRGYVEITDVVVGETYTLSAENINSLSSISAMPMNGTELVGSAKTVDANTSSVSFAIANTVDKIRILFVAPSGTLTKAMAEGTRTMFCKGTSKSYVPYASNTITLPYTLRSVGNVADELIVNEDGSGKIVQRVGTVTRTLASSTKSSSGLWDCGTLDGVALPSSASVKANAICDKYIVASTNDAKTIPFSLAIHTNGKIYVNDSSASSSLSVGVTIQFELATPIETSLTPEQVASIRQLQTYKGTTIIESEMDVVSVTYSGDIKAYIDYRIDQIINPTALNEVAPMNLDETEE